MVPAAYKTFQCDAETAGRVFAVDGQLLSVLLDLGLPHEGKGDDRRFDELDLGNISMHLRLPSGHWLATRRWAKSLRFAQDVGSPSYEFTLKASCPRPGHAGVCDFSISRLVEADFTPDGEAADTYTLRANLPPNAHELAGVLDPVVREARRLHFHQVPAQLSKDIGFVRDTGLAQCRTSTHYLVDVAARHGLTVRPAVGLFASAPFSIWHIWLEVLVDDEWHQADPFFLHTLAEWDVLDTGDWPLSCSPRSAVLRLGSATLMEAPMVTHAEEPAPWSVYTRRLP
jgi:hypothetical protein